MKTTIKMYEVLAICFFIFSYSCTTKEQNEKPKSTISYEKAKKMQSNYIETQVKPLQQIYEQLGISKKENIRDVTYDLKTIKQYIAYVEKEAAKKGIKDGLGLRIYIGAYEDGDVTMFFMPTIKKEDKTTANHFFYFAAEYQILESVDGLNYGSGGKPPKDLQ